MQRIHPVRLWRVILACLLFSSALAQGESPAQQPACAPADEAGLRALAGEFYADYAKKDLDGLFQLWSPKTPELEAHRQAMQKFFAGHEKIEVKGPTIRKMGVEAEKAKLRVEVEVSAIEVKTGKPATDLGKMMRVLEGVKEDGAWKIWREAPAEEDLAETLASLKTDAERSALLAAENEFVTEKLVREVIRQGVSLRWQGNYPEALARFRLAKGIAEQIGDKAGMAYALNGIAEVYRLQGDYALALDNSQKSLSMSEAMGDKAAVVRALNNVAGVHLFQGNYEQALEHLQKGLATSEALADKATVGRTLNNIGLVHYFQGNYEQALEHFQKSLALSEDLGDKTAASYALGNIGIVQSDQGNYARALEHFQKGLAISEALGDKGAVATALLNIGIVHRQQGNYVQALEHFQKSLAISEALGDKVAAARALNKIGVVYSWQGNNQQAPEYFHKSLAMSEASGNKTEASEALSNIGVVHNLQGNYEQALEYHQKSLALSEAVGDNLGVSITFDNIGTTRYNQGAYAQAIEYFRKSLATRGPLGKGSVSNTLTGMGRSYRALNQLVPARHAFEEAIAAIETLRTQVAGGEQDQERFFEERLVPYQSMVELLVAQNESAAALAYAERAKARVLLDVLHSGRVNVTKAMTAAEQEQERGFNGHLVSLNTQISRENLRPQPDPTRLDDLKAQLQKARLDFEAFQTGLYAAHPELKTQRGEVEPLTLEQAADLLPDAESALLEYVVTDERTYLFTLTRNAASSTAELKVYPLEIKRKELSERTASFREILAKGSPGFRQPAQELYDLLLKPAAAQLQGRTSLIVVPDGSLWELPFQALQPSAARYLIEDCAIAYAPSLTALREMIKLRDGKREPTGPSTLLAFGNPALGTKTISLARSVLMDEKLEPLPEAERQVNVIKQIYGPANSKVYIGAEAREERVKAEAGGYRILHLATHGILNDSNPMYSHLVLAQAEGDTKEDGLLEAWEIMKLDLRADLAVLSACETARGRVGAGEGMIGLSWALFVAGCPTTVVSQWKVDSAGTTELMVEFHHRLKSQMASGSDRLSAARALREAALKLQRTNQYRHPFYWAGFVATGKGF